MLAALFQVSAKSSSKSYSVTQVPTYRDLALIEQPNPAQGEYIGLLQRSALKLVQNSLYASKKCLTSRWNCFTIMR